LTYSSKFDIAGFYVNMAKGRRENTCIFGKVTPPSADCKSRNLSFGYV